MAGASISEDVGNIEQKFKVGLQNMERRFVDIEVAISEIVNRLNAIGEGGEDGAAAEDLRRRIDGLEDLIAVEQAGITELKDILSNIDKNLDRRFDTDAVEAKIKEVEDIVHIITKRLEKASDKPAKIDDKVTERIEGLEGQLEAMRGEIGTVVEKVMKDREPKREEDFEHVAHMEIGQLKQNLREIEKKVEERMESLKRGIEAVGEAAGRSGAPSKELSDHFKRYGEELTRIREEFKKYREDFDNYKEGLKKRMEDFERYKKEIEESKERVKSLSGAVSKLASHMDKLNVPPDKPESVEHIANLKKDVDEKLNVLVRVDEEMKKISERVEAMHRNFESRSGSMDDIENQVKKLYEELDNIRKDVKDSTGGGGGDGEFEKRFNDRFNELYNRINDRINERLKESSNESKNRADKVDERVNNTVKNLDEKIKSFRDSQKTPEVEKDIKFLKEEIKNIRNVVIKMDERLSRMREAKKGPKKDTISFIKNFGERMARTEHDMEDVKSRLGEISEKVKSEPAQEAHVREMMDKLVFLESRLAALETIMHRPQPIVLE